MWSDDETPEVIYEVIQRYMVYCEKQLGFIDERMRTSLYAVQQMLGWMAEMAWDRLPWWKRLTTDGVQWRWEYSERLRERGRTVQVSDCVELDRMLKEMRAE